MNHIDTADYKAKYYLIFDLAQRFGPFVWKFQHFRVNCKIYVSFLRMLSRHLFVKAFDRKIVFGKTRPLFLSRIKG